MGKNSKQQDAQQLREYKNRAAQIEREKQAQQNKLIRNTIHHYLSGETDKNGVSLLYLGVYPCV